MPGFDGTGPWGAGPMTGRGEGYCVVQLPDPQSGRAAVGFAGLAGVPVRLGAAFAPFAPTRLSLSRMYPWRWLGRGRGRGAGRGYGRRLSRRRW